ncbi:MAG: putative glycosyltransferase [Frankiales bacterium]|nr:putative glycosyltransferase [Frankiales bacterium]
MTTEQDWLRRRSTRTASGDLDRVRALLGTTTVSVVLPARDEEATVGALVAELRDGLDGLVHEIVVVDDQSRDATAARAQAAGARVVTTGAVRPDVPAAGKGGALWRGLAATTGELVLFLDADVPHFPAQWAASLLLPLLRDPEVVLVKAAYDRPLEVGGLVHPGSGGRVTRLVALPLLDVVAPELTVFAQPLAGETAARRTLLESLSFVGGYGVELALLLDTHAAVGLDGLAQVDLGERSHRHQSDQALALMATTLVHVVLHRSGWPAAGRRHGRVRRGEGGGLEHVTEPVALVHLPPLVATVP